MINQFKSVFTIEKDSNKMPDVPHGHITNLEHFIITTEGVQKLLKRVNPAKAVGPDGIPNTVLKTCADTIIAPALTQIFQLSIDTGDLPNDWRNANIAPVYKKSDRHAAENYRPVSLTSVSSKLLEHIICKQLLDHLERHNILTTLNHGFRSGYSCETQLAVTLHDLVTSFDKGKQTDVIILDFSKAFDTVPHKKLLHKLQEYGISGPLHQWLTNFLTKREMRVVVDGVQSDSVYVDSGVPQGTVLGPILFLCHINDLPNSVQSQVRLFADDCLLYRNINTPQDSEILQSDLKQLEQWATRWGMTFNAKKCYVMSVKQKYSHFYHLDNTILETVHQNPYLGVLLSDDLKWEPHITKMTSKAASILGLLRRNLKACPQEIKKLAYITLVRSSLEYASPILQQGH